MCGDGGFLMNIQELETAVRLCLPLIVIIWCDYDYGMHLSNRYMNLAEVPLPNLIIPILLNLQRVLEQ